MKDDKHESKEFLDHITASTRFTRSHEKQEGGGTTFQSGWATFLSRKRAARTSHIFYLRDWVSRREDHQIRSIKKIPRKRLGTTSSSACDQRFNTQVTHCVSQIQKDVQMSCTLNRNGITGVLQCNRASLWKEQGGDAASRDVEVRIRRRLVFFWDKPRGGTKKNKKISNGLEQSPSQPPPLCTRVFFILFLWIICCLEWQQSQNSLLKKKQKTTPLPPSFSSPMLVTNSRLQQQTHWSLHLLH